MLHFFLGHLFILRISSPAGAPALAPPAPVHSATAEEGHSDTAVTVTEF